MNTPSEENVEKRQMIWVWVFVCVLFGADFLYGLYGAFTGSVYVPIRRHGGEACYISGTPAWSYPGGAALVWLAVMVRWGAFGGLSEKLQRTLGLILFLLGIAVFVYIGLSCGK